MPTSIPVFDDDLEEGIKYILGTCGTNTAGIAIRRQFAGESSEHETRTIITAKEPGSQSILPGGDEIFHIASITKILIATALIVAIEVKALGDGPDNLYARFKGIQEYPLTKVYNDNSNTKMEALPGDPTLYHLLIHSNGFLSSNDRLLAPCGTPLMTIAEVPEKLLPPTTHDKANASVGNKWAGYSNVNYSAVAMAIEAMWRGSLESFVEETLLKPLKMNSTFIGTPANRINNQYVVDSNGKSHKIQQPVYRADGAEAAALGAYSTVKDLDIFFKFIIDTFYQKPCIPGFDLAILSGLLDMTNTVTESLEFMPFGLFTRLDSPTLGILSTNRLQFPEKEFSTYTVLPKQKDSDIHVYYMAGSAIGCNCATALHLSEDECFAVTVLTNTSGPVDAADHILRLVLQKMARWMDRENELRNLSRMSNVTKMVERANSKTKQKWKTMEEENAKLVNKGLKTHKTIEGKFQADGLSQWLEISKRGNGKTYIAVNSPSTLSSPGDFELFWVNNNSVKVFVPPHLSVDCLDDCDWSNLMFEVEVEGQVVKTLTRMTSRGQKIVYRKDSL